MTSATWYRPADDLKRTASSSTCFASTPAISEPRFGADLVSVRSSLVREEIDEALAYYESLAQEAVRERSAGNSRAGPRAVGEDVCYS